MKRRRSRRRRCGMVAHMPPPCLKRTPPLLNVAALGATVVVGVLGATVVVGVLGATVVVES